MEVFFSPTAFNFLSPVLPLEMGEKTKGWAGRLYCTLNWESKVCIKTSPGIPLQTQFCMRANSTPAIHTHTIGTASTHTAFEKPTDYPDSTLVQTLPLRYPKTIGNLPRKISIFSIRAFLLFFIFLLNNSCSHI
jgi:hypothetical protein